MSDERLKEIRRIEAAATKNWAMPDSGRASISEFVPPYGWNGLVATFDAGDYARSKEDGLANTVFAVTARSAVPELLAEVDRLKAENAALRKASEETWP